MFLRLSQRAAALKPFGAEMITIVLGILIALGFDGLAERQKERRLVAQAKESIRKELADNKRELEGVLEANVENRKKVDAIITAIDQLLQKKTGELDFKLHLLHADLAAAGWETAQHSGALAHMDYDDIRRYTRVYGQQRDYLRLQERLLDQFIIVAVGRPAAEIKGLDHPELQAYRQGLRTVIQHMSAVRQVGQALVQAYAQF